VVRHRLDANRLQQDERAAAFDDAEEDVIRLRSLEHDLETDFSR
jgi:hypothetical protein